MKHLISLDDALFVGEGSMETEEESTKGEVAKEEKPEPKLAVVKGLTPDHISTIIRCALTLLTEAFSDRQPTSKTSSYTHQILDVPLLSPNI